MSTVAATDKHYTARIIERRDLSEDLWLIRVDPGGPCQFKAGQYATLGLENGDKRIERAYSIVSSPYEQGLEVFIQLVPQRELTPHLYKLQLGDTMLCLKLAKGRFTVEMKSGRTKHLLLATVTGNRPVCQLCAHPCTKTGKAGTIPCPANTSSTVCREEATPGNSDTAKSWIAFAAEVPWFKFVTMISRPSEDASWTGESGRVDDLLRKYADPQGLRPETTTAYLCGHPGMCENGQDIRKRAGWQKDLMFEEVYFIPGKEAAAE